MAQPVIPPISGVNAVQALAAGATNRDSQTPTFPVGTAISGFVINRDASNNPIVRTDQGDITVPSNVFIKTGSEVTFRSDASNNVQILSIDHLAPADYAAQTTRDVPTDSIQASELEPQIALPNAPAANTPAAPNVTLPALQSLVLQANDTPPAAVPPLLTQLQAGTPITLTVVDVELPPIPISVNTIPETSSIARFLPQAAGQAPTTGPTPQAPNSNAVNTALNAGNAAYAQSAFAGGIAPLLTGAVAPTAKAIPQPGLPQTEIVTEELAPETPGQLPNPQAATTPTTQQTPAQLAQPQAQPNQPAFPNLQTLTPNTSTNTAQPQVQFSLTTQPGMTQTPNGPLFQATVIGHGEDGLNIVQTNFATLKIYTTQPLPTGTTLQVQATVTEPASITPTINPFASLAARLPSIPDDFPYLTQALAQLQAQDPNAARDVQQQLPVIGPKFTSGLLFFLTAVKNGTADELLNAHNAKTLDTLMPGVLTRFGKDMADLTQNFTNSPLTDWKGVTLPLIFQQQAEPARLYIRDEREGGPQATGGIGGQRFVLDVNLSELGPLQLDGFIRQGSGAKSFELYLRSGAPLDSGITQAIRGIFETSTATTGLTGNIVFQAGTEHFIRPQLKPIGPGPDEGARTILA